jgi:thymidylate synthase
MGNVMSMSLVNDEYGNDTINVDIPGEYMPHCLKQIKINNDVLYENTKSKSDEYQYYTIVQNIIKNGDIVNSRNSKTYVNYGETMKFDLSNYTLPIFTHKKVAYKIIFKELLWFISGDTNNNTLQKQNVHIWDQNATDYMLSDSRVKTGELGPIYGHQWRFYGKNYYNKIYTEETGHVDQLQNVINMLTNPEERYSRRIIMCTWNPLQQSEMALPPCHSFIQFHVTSKDELICELYQRSGDMGLGIPYNVTSYSMLTHLLAHHCGLKAKQFIHHIGNAHIYENHVTDLEQRLNSTVPMKFPCVNILRKCKNINDYTLNDIEVFNYNSYDKLRLDMTV